MSVGPDRPHRGLSTPDVGLPLWTPQQWPVARWWWVGCHGGAGVTKLHHEVPGGADLGVRAWPIRPDGGATQVVLVARTHARGLTAAQDAARQWASGAAGNVVLLGLIAVADAPGRMPKALSDSLRFVAGGLPRLWRIPWVEDWRSAYPSHTGPSIRETVRLAADLARLVPSSLEIR
ncbi:DUF6668 family protein [Yinghuangia sp. YIM S09857]|uniref:DUF6668 family protein n=1 Tax=Yinghuangia sp. YIM S09857 TaxID=3436929 RepID=UPI003F532C02